MVDEDPDGLWRVDRQRELMLRRGCSVQFEVEFAGLSVRAGVCEPQLVLLEAAVDGDALLASGDRPSHGDELEVMVADLNGMSGGRFWHSAAEVQPWWHLES